MKYAILIAGVLTLLQSCATVQPFSANSVPPPPNYANNSNWAALPSLNDPADRTPNATFQDLQSSAQVDVFFVHPTIFLDKRAKAWNADLADAKLNKNVDESTILFQASAFNGSGKIYAPRYRQAHYRSFFTTDKPSAAMALNLAYEDIRTAFEYYLTHYNQNRPIIIAAHSQGTVHAIRLLKEFFENKNLRNRLVVAYLVGWPIKKDAFADIPVCQNADQTGCYCTWRSFKYGHTPKGFVLGDSIAVTNPLSWKTDGLPADKSLNEGMIARNFEKVLPNRADAQAINGLLWVHKPKFPGSVFFQRKNYHIADYNLFYVSLRKNAQHRVDSFWK